MRKIKYRTRTRPREPTDTRNLPPETKEDMNNINKNNIREAKEKEQDLSYLRGYCRVCNRHYFYRNKLDTGHLQFRQHHGGICQNCNYACATINSKKRL